MDGTSARTTLGVAPHASETDIKAAYRSMAKAAHPDLGGDCARFDQLTRAYECALADVRRTRPVIPDHALSVAPSTARPGLGGTGWARNAVMAAAHAASGSSGRRRSTAPPRTSAMTFADHLRRATAA